MFSRTSRRARHVRPGGTLRSPFHNCTARNRFLQRLLSGIAIVAMFSPADASLAATCEQKPGGTAYCEPEPELWGGDAYGGKYIYPSYGAKVDAVMGTVISIVGPGAEPVYGPRESLPPPNACGFTDQINTEQGLPDDAQRHARHVFHEIDGRPLGGGSLPVVQHACAGAAHDGREAFDALAVERRLRQASLPPPEIAFAGEQTFADERFHTADEAALPVVAVVVLQHVLDVVGVIQHVDDERPSIKADHVAVLACRPAQKRQRVASACIEEVERSRVALAGRAPCTLDTECRRLRFDLGSGLHAPIIYIS